MPECQGELQPLSGTAENKSCDGRQPICILPEHHMHVPHVLLNLNMAPALLVTLLREALIDVPE